jgi:cytochrome c
MGARDQPHHSSFHGSQQILTARLGASGSFLPGAGSTGAGERESSMMNRATITFGAALAALMAVAACGGQDGAGTEGGAARGDGRAAPAEEEGLTPEQLEKGVGPVTELSLGPLDARLAAEGEEIYQMKCAACHEMETRLVGPPLGDVLERRTPEFVMNMILNPEEMVRRHPSVREMLAQYYTPMPDQNLDDGEARAVLEYLRQAGADDENR